MDENGLYRRRVFTAVTIAVGVIGLLLFLYGTAHVLLLLFTSVLIAIILRSLSQWLHTHTRLSEKLSLAVVIIGCLGAATATAFLLGQPLAEQFDQLAQKIPQSIRQLEKQISQYQWGQQLLNQMPDNPSLQNIGIFSRLTGIVSALMDWLANAFLLLFIAVFLAIEPETYIDGIATLVPPDKRDRAREVLYAMGDTLQKWLITRFFSVITVTLISTVGLLLLNVPLALTLGIIAGLAAFVPTIGSAISLIPALLIAFLQSPQTTLFVFALSMLAQAVDNYLITPIVVKYTIRIPPAIIISSQLITGALFGFIGLVLAAPLTVAAMTLTRMVYVEDFLESSTNSNPQRFNETVER